MRDSGANTYPSAPSGGLEVFAIFLRLGLTSFGGPIAHLGYFRQEFVERRRWLSDDQFAGLLVLCQFLPGPASSQLGFAIGLFRAGWAGALLAFIGFTLPSALLMLAFAALLPGMDARVAEPVIAGLELVALAVIAQGLLGMFRQLCPDPARASIAVMAAVLVLVAGSATAQISAVLIGAVLGAVACRQVAPPAATVWQPGYSVAAAKWWGLLFVALLLGLPLLTGSHSLLALASEFYRVGALVFGGGHVVLPLLEEAVVVSGEVSAEQFLAGYGLAQALPGPMFSLAAGLGALTEGGWVAGIVALLAIFVPGFLLLLAVLPLWSQLLARPQMAAMVAGVNAAVVGILAAALYDPVWTSAIGTPVDLAIAMVALLLLVSWRVSALWVVLGCVLARVALSGMS